MNADKAFMATNVVLPTEVMAINEREEEILHKLDAQVRRTTPLVSLSTPLTPPAPTYTHAHTGSIH